jgi:Ni/Co efflux regulator RcnB
MKRILLLSAAMLAILASPVMAQRGDDHDHGGGGGGERGGGRPPAAAHAPAPQAAPAPHAAPAAPAAGRAAIGQDRAQRDQAQRAQFDNNRRDPGRDANRGNDNNRPGANRGNDDHRFDANRGNDNRGRDFGRNDNRPGNNGFRGARPSPNYSQYHRAFNAPQRYRYRGPAYHRPPGFSYRRWNYGDFLPSLYWGSSYWINDSSYYNLMPAPPGTVWVRYGDDAVLIDRYTGEVIQVEYSAFY